MTLFINAKLIDPKNQSSDIGWLRVENGVITARGLKDAPQCDEVVDCEGHCLAPGIIDIGVKIPEPGERHKESFASAGNAAAAGGVTTMVTRPDTLSAIDTPETLEFVTRRATSDSIVKVKHLSALTKERAGAEMVEIGFMKDAGAVAFTDCDHVVQDTKVFIRALTYAKACDALVIGHPQEPILSEGACATSSPKATLQGLPAVSPIAERMEIDRTLALIEMTKASYHFDQVTTARALPALERAKNNGNDITAGVSIHHLVLNQEDVGDYRTFFKIKPPLRSEDDRLAIIKALETGLIDIIASMHTPQDEESKRLPFEQAASGAVGLETFLPAALKLYHSGQLTLPQLFRAMSFNPARRLELAGGDLEVGSPADLVLFDPDAEFILDRFVLKSKSKNTPFDGEKMNGVVCSTWVDGQQVFSKI